MSGKRMKLSEIATFSDNGPLAQSLEGMEVALSPKPGSTLVISSDAVVKYVHRKALLETQVSWKGSPKITVYRKGMEITSSMLLTAINNYISENSAHLPQAEITFTPKSVPVPFHLPIGELSWEIFPSNPDLIKSSRFSIIIRVDGRVRKNLALSGDLQAIAPVIIGKTSLRRGSILQPNNVTLALKDISKMKNPCFDLRKIIGKKLKKSIRSGQVINANDVEFPPLVKRGQLVKIIVNKGNLFLTATGIAKMNGKLNQVIRVRNAQSNKQIFCRVTAPGIVEVTI